MGIFTGVCCTINEERMDATALNEWLFLIYFVYGLAFFGMGLAMALESGRSPSLAEAVVLRPLAAFGFVHGAHEWFESYLFQAPLVPAPLPQWVPWLRIGTLAVSFAFLLLFGYRLLGLGSLLPIYQWMQRYRILWLYWFVLLFLVIAIYRQDPSRGQDFWDAMARYLLAMPASLLATLALSARSRQSQAENRPELARFFGFTAAGLAIYAVTQLFVRPLDMFPANIINQQIFSQHTGIPIQLVRTIIAVLITYSLFRAIQVVEKERNLQLFAVQQARLEALQQRDALRRALLQHTVQAQEDERARIARELHDETAQVLSAFSLQLAALGTSLKRQPDALAKVLHLQDLSRQISQGLYRLVGDLRPPHLDDLGLIPALDYLLAGVRSSENIEIKLQVEGRARRLELPIETILFRVVQEAVTNIIRHAQTRQAGIKLCFGDEEVRLSVSDQGIGFDPDGPFRAPRGWGLEGMRERVEAAGGSFTLTSVSGRGTTVNAVIPISSPTVKE